VKTVVSVQDFLELEIHPDPLLAGYLSRLERDVVDRWRSATIDVPCPGCGSSERAPAFVRFDVPYHECTGCGSVYASPRPSEAEIVELSRIGSAAVFWREQVSPRTAAARREKLVRPRAEWVIDGLLEHLPGAGTGLDLSPYAGPLLEELCADGGRRMLAGSWLSDLDVPAPPAAVRVQPLTLATVATVGPVDFVTAFDVVDRAPDLPALLDALGLVVRPGGLVFLTAANADGFDIQVLWDRAWWIVPPDKMNLLSADGVVRRAAQSGWDILELSTPGMFDVEHVRHDVEQHADAAWPRFVRRLVAHGARRPDVLGDFQQFLQRHRLASFARVLLRRRG
jgi:hypothetical protein